MSIYSQGFSFGSFLQDGVDPRTRQYTCTIPLYETPAQTRNCPPLNVTLAYNPLDTQDFGFGTGWSLNLSFYHHRSGTLRLSTGEHYKVTETDGSVTVKDKKLQSFHFTKEDNGDYRAVHKSGQIEVLSNCNNTYNTSVPTEVIAANGRSLDLVWTTSGEQPQLSAVKDGEEALLQIVYKDSSVTITRAPGNTSEASTLTLLLANSLLTACQLPLPGKPAWTFSYEAMGGGGIQCVTEVRSPSGLLETLTYQAEGHRLPEGAPYETIPYVLSHTLWPGSGQPQIVTSYAYSDYNFLGYGGTTSWDDGEDNLYQVADDYQYTTTLVVSGGATTTYTYNKFHLVIQSQRQQGSKQVTQTIAYHALDSTEFPDQPPQYQLPKRIQTTYRDTIRDISRTETTLLGFDIWGNPVREVESNGIQADRVYYPATGEVDSSTGEVYCPGDPYGFQRYLKRETVTPAPSSYSTPTQITSYKYGKLPAAGCKGASYFIAVRHQQTQIRETQETQVNEETEYTYIEQPTGPDHGRLLQQVAHLPGQSPTKQDYSYQYPSAGRLTQTTRITSGDSHTVSTEHESSLASGHTLRFTDHAGVPTDVRYDQLGRLVQMTVSPGTAYEARRTYGYTMCTGSDDTDYRVTVTDAKGVQTRSIMDGLGRVRRMERQDDDGQGGQASAYGGTFRVTQERSYNAQDQCIEVVEVDWLRDATRDAGVSEQRSRQTFQYDDWGRVCKVTEGTVVTLSQTDPIALTHIQGIEGEGKTETQFNLFHQVTLQTHWTRDGKRDGQVVYTYDGLGRVITKQQGQDQSGGLTRYQYDVFDRITKTIWPNGRTTTARFVAHSSVGLPVNLAVNGDEPIAEQRFDGLERLLERTVGGRRTEFSYSGDAAVQPSEITSPQGNQQWLQYESALDSVLTGRRSRDTVDAYQYDPCTANLLHAKNAEQTQNWGYLPSGLVCREEIQTGEIAGRDDQSVVAYSMQSTHSMAGRLQSYTDVHGQLHQIEYDGLGRPERLTQGNLSVTFRYDHTGRLSRSTSSVHKDDDLRTLTTRVSYDDFGWETARVVTDQDGKLVHELTLGYGDSGQITSRSLVRDSDSTDKVSRHETFQYDPLGRISEYQCWGSNEALPADEHGNRLRGQQFEFDACDNIVRVVTTFDDEEKSSNVATYRYSREDRTQLLLVTNTHPSYRSRIRLEYDENGCLTQDERGRELVYDTANRLRSVRDADGRLLSRYSYDAMGNLVRQAVPGQPDLQFFYRGNTLVAMKRGDRWVSYVWAGGEYWGQQTVQTGEDTQWQIWASDVHGSPLAWLQGQESALTSSEMHHQAYTPFGWSPSCPSLGFNGQWRDPVTGWYHLGNGSRVYNPVLMRFHSPDTWSPFESGEINAYAYCLGDPINRVDPSGHFSLSLTWRDVTLIGVGLGVGIVVGLLTGGAGFAIAAAVVSDVATGMIYDAASSGKAPTWESVGSDALYGLVGELAGFGVGQIAARGLKVVNRGIVGILVGGSKLRRAGGLPAWSKFSHEVKSRQKLERQVQQMKEMLDSKRSKLTREDRKKLKKRYSLKSHQRDEIRARENGRWEFREPREISDTIRATTDQYRKAKGIDGVDAPILSNYLEFRNLVREQWFSPHEAGKGMDFKSLKQDIGEYQIRLSKDDRVTFILDENRRIITTFQMFGHT